MNIEKINRVLIIVLALVLSAVSYLTRSSNFFLGAVHTFVLLFVIPFLILLVWRRRLGEYGFQLGEWKEGLKYTAVLLIVSVGPMVYGARLWEFKIYYPLWKGALAGWEYFVLFQLVVGVIMFSTEFFYRGFLLFSLRDKWWGNLFHAFIYMLVHVGKPNLEVPYSFVAGYAFGWVDLKTKSIMPSFLMHWLSSILFDLLIMLL